MSMSAIFGPIGRQRRTSDQVIVATRARLMMQAISRRVGTDDQMEVVSLIGNVLVKDGAPFTHIHVTVGRHVLSIVGGLSTTLSCTRISTSGSAQKQRRWSGPLTSHAVSI